jgi:uncharacterized protein YkwD
MNTKKKIISAVAVLSLFFAEIPLTYAAYFSDVSTINRYYTAIEYLAENNFIRGYPDGTFQPDRIVNRAEFLKMVMTVSGTDISAGNTAQFPDVEKTAWYAPYVGGAFARGWIQGYTDGTFKPEQGISKAEGLKIIGKAQSWKISASLTPAPYSDTPVSAWFTPYIAYAKDHNFLEETGSNFIPDAILHRGKVSEILYRTDVAKNTNGIYTAKSASVQSGTASQISINPVIPASPALNFSPVSYKSIPQNFYANINLDASFPNTFYLNEVYYFKGQILSGNYDDTLVYLAPENETDSSKFINFSGKVNGNSFNVPVVFRKAGNYRIGIIRGKYGTSAVASISVLPALPSTPSVQNTSHPENPKIVFSGQKTTLTWNENDNEMVRLTVFQGSRTKTYLFRQGYATYSPDYADFQGFTDSQTYYKLESAPLKTESPLEISAQFAAGDTKSFLAAKHYYCENNTDLISIPNPTEISSTLQTLKIDGTAKTNLLSSAAIIRPDGNVDTSDMTTAGTTGTYYGSTVIESGSSFSLVYSPAITGTYIMEINAEDGQAALNCPVYYTSSIPLIPDYFDLNANIGNEPRSDISLLRSEMLDMINSERQKMGIGKVALDTSLNNLAQLHSEDMVNRNFFDHINPDGQTPEDRRIAMKIPTPVGENLAKAPTLVYAHNGLMRSGIHRMNIFNSKWTKVGIGIDWNAAGQMLITQEFSSPPLTEADLITLENDIYSDINIYRTSNNIAVIALDQGLSSVADIWSQKMASQDFFSFTSPGGESLYTLVQNQVSGKGVQAILIQSNDGEQLKQKILAGEDAKNGQWRKLGLGIKANDIGTLNATLLYTTY